MNWIKWSWANLFLPLIITVMLLEVVGFFIFDSRYHWDLRYLYFSQNAVVNDTTPNGNKPIWRYRENYDVRSIAVYSDFSGSSVEYDCSFRTNKFGYIDTGPIDEVADYLVLGDSFTEGQGGCPWLTEATINDDHVLSQYEILNGGLQGTGVRDFERTLEYLQDKIEVKNIVLIVISNDFKRLVGTQWDVTSDCYLQLACSNTDYWHFKPISITRSELEADASARRNARGVSLREEVSRYSFTYYVYKESKKLFKSNRITDAAPNTAMYEDNFSALLRMREKYEDMKIILVPQRDEVGLLGRENLDSLNVKKFFAENRFEYSTCMLTSDDYMPIDGHPNSTGYRKLFECLRETISASNN